MRQLLVVVLALFCVISYATAQDYYVYTVTGKVYSSASAKKKKVIPRMVISEGTNLSLGKEARIVLINKIKRQMCTIYGSAQGTVGKLLKKSSSSISIVSKQYIDVLINQSSDNTSRRSAYMQSAASSFRDSDSLIIKRDSILIQGDTIRNSLDSVNVKK